MKILLYTGEDVIDSVETNISFYVYAKQCILVGPDELDCSAELYFSDEELVTMKKWCETILRSRHELGDKRDSYPTR